MATFDLTPTHRVVPGVASWGSTSDNLPVADQDNNHVTSLRDLEREFHVRVRLDSVDIHKNVWPSELMGTVYLHSYPLRELLETKTTVKITREWLGYWEVYSQTIVPGLVRRMEKRALATREAAMKRAKERREEYEDKPVSVRGVPIRTFHVHDNRSSSVQSMQKAINRVEFETGAQINWEWLATHTPKVTESDLIEIAKNKGRWTVGVDGEGAITVANMRAWKNKIATVLKVADVVVVNNESDDDAPSGIAFAVMNLAAGGSAIIRIPRIANTAIVSMIHVFAQCFEGAKIVHTLADDRMYLCGDGFLDNVTSKHQKLLYEFCDVYPGSPDMAPFTREYMASDQFVETVDRVMDANRKIQGWRYGFYEKLLETYTRLYKSSAGKTFTDYVENVLSDAYKDQSSRWAAATGFNFFAQSV